MYKSIQSITIKKLFLAGTVFSFVMGLIVGLIEIKRIDTELKALVFTEAENFYYPYLQYYNQNKTEQLAVLKSLMEEKIKQQQFVLLALYYNDKQMLVKATAADIDAIEARLITKQADETIKAIRYRRLIHQGKIYIQMIAPFMVLEEQDVVAYFEGIYQLPKQQTQVLLLRILTAVVQVMISIIAVTLLLYPIIISLNKDVIKINQDLLLANIDTLRVLGNAIAKRDSDTNSHNFRVTIYAISLAEALHLPKRQIQSLIKGAFLHDIGKIGISDNILLKPDKLSASDFEIMKQHVRYGVEIIKNSHWLTDAQDVVEYHHEKYDGTGYLQSLSGEKIPIIARVFAIVDVFDALTSKRPYKQPFSLQQSMKLLQAGSGKHFDPALIKTFGKISDTLYNQYGGVEDELYLRQRLDSFIARYF